MVGKVASQVRQHLVYKLVWLHPADELPSGRMLMSLERTLDYYSAD